MPNKLKILLTFLILTLSILFLDISNVFAVGNVSQSWKNVNESNKKEDLLFRTYTTPHKNTIEGYIKDSSDGQLENGEWTYTHGGKTYKSKWVLNDGSISDPLYNQFNSMALVFHTKPMCTYDSGSKVKYNYTTDALDWNVNSITKAFENSYAVATTPEEVSNYNSTNFLTVYNTTGTFGTITWGTRKTVTGLSLGKNTKTTEYRHAIITSNGKNIYIADNIIHNEDIPTIIKNAHVKENNSCYVSNILLSHTVHDQNGKWREGLYEVAENSERFWMMHDKGYDTYFWSTGMYGKENKAMGAVLNLYDNIIEFTQFSKRQVLVRHINIGANTRISSSIVNSGTRITDGLTYEFKIGNETKKGTKYKDSTYQEQITDIDIDLSVSKDALADTDTYKCIGYNVSTASSLTQAQKNLDTKISNGTYTSGKKASITGSADTANDEVTIIDFYYSEYANDVYVNHVYVDEKGKVLEKSQQSITPNDTVTNGKGQTITRKNTDVYSTEQYAKRLKEEITTQIAKSLETGLGNGSIEYKGYKTSKEKVTVDSLVGKKVSGAKTDTTIVTLPDDVVTITYYYHYKGEPPPPPPETRDIYVNHVYVDKDGKVLEKNKQKITPNNTTTTTDGVTITRKNTDTYSTEQYGVEEGTQINTQIAKSLESKINSGDIQYKGYTTSNEKVTVDSLIGTKVSGAKTDKKVTLPEDIVTITYYYYIEEPPPPPPPPVMVDLYVNHVYVDKNGKVLEKSKQKILPNALTTTTDGATIARKNITTIYSTERYNVEEGTQINTQIATSLIVDIGIGNVDYRGYKISKEKVTVDSLIGTQIYDAKMDKKVTLPKDAVTITYYYYREATQIPQQEPTKDIAGTVFVNAEQGEISTKCNDTGDGVLITSIPSGINATVGIAGIPKYMVGAITTKYTPPSKTQTMNITLNFVMGNEKKTVKYTDLKYRVGFYTITDMMVYELQKATLYDAGSGNTIGSSIFNWKDGKYQPQISKSNLSVKLTGIRGEIKNTDSAIANKDNYVAVSITDRAGNTSSKGSANSSLNRVYLTTEQIKAVDANGDGKINSTDITYAQNKLKDYLNALNAAKRKTEQKQTAYDNAVKEQANLKKLYEEAQQELGRLKEIYDAETLEQQQKQQSINYIKEDIQKLEQDEVTKKNALDSLNTALQNKNQEIQAKQTEVDNAETRKAELHKAYQDALAEQNRLASLAQCVDKMPEENTIYGESEDVIKCRENKEAYQKYLEDKIVENKYNEYLNYENGEYATLTRELASLKQDYTNLEEEHRIAVGAHTDAVQAIKDKQDLLEIAERDQETHWKFEYLPAKAAYEAYEATYILAKDRYDSHVENKTIEKAQEALNEGKAEQVQAQKEYDEYKAYSENLDDKYDEYKKLYDEFQSITGTNVEIAKTLGLKINIQVQNMLVKLNNEVLGESEKNTATYTTSLYDYLNIDEKDIPQVTTDMPKISKDLYSGIKSTYIKKTDYKQTTPISKDVLNGVRALSGKAEYTAKVVIGERLNSQYNRITDTVYYQDKSTDSVVYVFTAKNRNITKEYKVNVEATNAAEKYKEVEPVNIYTPITVSSEFKTSASQLIDQREKGTTDETKIIQLNVPFTVNLENEAKPVGYSINSTKRFSTGYYIKFDFDVNKVYINGKPYKSGKVIKAGTWIGMISRNSADKAYITAQPYGELKGKSQGEMLEEISSYTVRAVSYNADSELYENSVKFNSLSQMRTSGEFEDTFKNICTNSTYMAEKSYNVTIINRVYDFKVTDLKDVSWKNVFRMTTSSVTNKHTGNVYYAGTTKWNTESEQANSIVTRTSKEIGRNPLRTLPLGPYKNADNTYTKAPKLGYRFSFDMKVLGSYYYTKDGKQEVRTDKKVAIKTKFYYISKNGKTFLEESDGRSEGIYLFYKNNDGKYIRIDDNGGNYKLRFTPNDGYRYIQDTAKTTLSTKSLELGNLRNLTLTHEMATVSKSGSTITYYGEYKLPNSTIVVKVDENGKYDVNNPLKDGYIGVIFEIVAYSGTLKTDFGPQELKLSYSAETDGDDIIDNTSQWDYEGFLGYTSYGKRVADGQLSMKLEKGKWNINNNVYNKIKGTVILYDTDQRAATDYE